MAARSALVWLLLMAPGAAMACTLAFAPGHRPPPGRVAGIELLLRNGAVAGMARLPFGWRFTVDNDPSWTAKASGQAIVGAAFLEPEEAVALFSITPGPGGGCAALLRPGLLRLRLHDAGRERAVVPAPSSLRLVEDQAGP